MKIVVTLKTAADDIARYCTIALGYFAKWHKSEGKFSRRNVHLRSRVVLSSFAQKNKTNYYELSHREFTLFLLFSFRIY